MADRFEGNILTNLGSNFTKELKAIVQAVIQDSLRKDSDLGKSVEFVYGRNDTVYMYVSRYYEDVAKGRKPRAKKIPLYALIQWIKKQRITSTKYNMIDLAAAIQRSIYINGIQGKQFIETVNDSVLQYAEVKLADNLEKVVGDSLVAAINVK